MEDEAASRDQAELDCGGRRTILTVVTNQVTDEVARTGTPHSKGQLAEDQPMENEAASRD